MADEANLSPEHSGHDVSRSLLKDGPVDTGLVLLSIPHSILALLVSEVVARFRMRSMLIKLLRELLSL